MSGLVGTRQDERRERRTVTDARKDPARIYGTGGLRRSRSVRKYTDRLISARGCCRDGARPPVPAALRHGCHDQAGGQHDFSNGEPKSPPPGKP
jgi:hypothetical protein